MIMTLDPWSFGNLDSNLPPLPVPYFSRWSFCLWPNVTKKSTKSALLCVKISRPKITYTGMCRPGEDLPATTCIKIWHFLNYCNSWAACTPCFFQKGVQVSLHHIYSFKIKPIGKMYSPLATAHVDSPSLSVFCAYHEQYMSAASYRKLNSYTRKVHSSQRFSYSSSILGYFDVWMNWFVLMDQLHRVFSF